MSAEPVESDLRVDPQRRELWTGIYVRALDDGAWVSADIAALDRASLTRWLRSRGGENPWAESVVLVLVGHPQIEDVETGGRL